MDNRGNELSDLDNIEYFWEKPQMELDVVYIPGIDSPFSPTACNDLEMGEGGSFENPIVLYEVEDKVNYPPKTPVSERPTEPPRLLRSHSFGRRIEKVPEFVYRTLFEWIYSVCVCEYYYRYLFKFFH